MMMITAGGSNASKAQLTPIFSEIMHNTRKLKVIKCVTKALNHSKNRVNCKIKFCEDTCDLLDEKTPVSC